jgi:two-component system, cell cycle sensor histidine kinase and response regulator CckA
MTKYQLKIIVGFILAGLCLVVLDAAGDWIFFLEGTFTEALITKVPGLELFTRAIYLTVFFLFGLVMSLQLEARRKSSAEAKQKARQLEIMVRGAHSFSEAHDVDEILRRLVAHALELTNASDGGAGLLINGEIVFKEYNDSTKVFPIDFAFPKGHGVPGHVYETEQPYITNDAPSDPHVIPEIQKALGFLTLIDLPIIGSDGEFIGCLELHNKKDKSYFDTFDLELLQGLASTAAVAIGNARALEQARAAETAREESEEHFELMMQQSPSVIELYDVDGLQVDVNAAYEKLWGFPASHTVGKFNVLESKEVEDTGLMAYVKRAYAGETVQVPEYRFDSTGATEAHGVGRVRWLSTRIYPLRDKAGNVKNIVITHEDISERKFAEEERLELERKMQRLKNMETLGMLAGGVAHDLNNVLSGIVSYPDLLLHKLPDDSPLRKPIQTIKDSGRRAADIVQDLLTFARRGIVANEVVGLNRIVNDYLASPEYCELKARHPRVTVNAQLDESLMNIRGSRLHLSKTVMNLVSNAIEASDHEADGMISISTANQYLDRPIKGHDKIEEGEYAVLTITDSGHGIAEEDIEKIFDPFFTKKQMGMSGTGLGMSIVYGTVTDHKGYINVESIVDSGTTFTLYLPITRDEQKVQGDGDSLDPIMGQGESVLIIDDDEQQRILGEGMLSLLNYAVTVVTGGEEAVEYLKSNSADIIVLDMIMDPGMDGLDTYKAILETRHGQKAIIASGYAETDRVAEAQSLGAGGYVKKPFTLAAIGKAIKEELGQG